jgi:hypothetical protein
MDLAESEKLKLELELLELEAEAASLAPRKVPFSPEKGVAKVMGPVNRGLASGLVSAGRSVPGVDMLSALVMNEVDKVKTLAKGRAPNPNFLETYPMALNVVKDIGDKIENASPVGKALGRVAGGITTFKGFRDMLPASTGAIHDIAKSGLANILSGQSQEVDPSRITSQAAWGMAPEAVGQMVKNWSPQILERLGRSLMATVIKTPLDKGKKGKDLAQTALDMGLRGGFGKMGKQLDTAENALETQIQAELRGTPGMINRQSVGNTAEQGASTFNVSGGAPQRQQFMNVVDDFRSGGSEMGPVSDAMSAGEANVAKRALGKLLGKNFYKGDASQIAPGLKEGQEALRGSLQGAIEEVAPNVKPFNQQVGNVIDLMEEINRNEARSLNSGGVGLKKLIGGGMLGGMAGFGSDQNGLTFDPGRAIPAALLMMLGSKLSESPAVATHGAQMMKGLSESAKRAPDFMRYLGPTGFSLFNQ